MNNKEGFMSTDNSNEEFSQPLEKTVETKESLIAERIATPKDCEGHFGENFSIVPAFVVSRWLAEQVEAHETERENQICLPNKINMKFNRMIAEGEKFSLTETKDTKTGLFSMILTKENGNMANKTTASVEEYSTNIFVKTLELPDFDISSNTPDQKIIKTSDDIAEIIPQGENIQFIDFTKENDNPNVLLEAVHKITIDDFTNAGKDNFRFDTAKTLEGFGQSAYLYFQEQINNPDLLPFFAEVDIEIDYHIQPKVGDEIYYQLTKFDLNGRKKTSGLIEGVVLDSNKQVLATYSAKTRAIKKAALKKIINNN